MQTSSLAERYARALMDAALEENLKSRVDSDVLRIHQLFESSGELAGLLNRVSRAPDLAASVTEYLSRQLEPSEPTGNLLNLLVQRKRLGILQEIVAAYMAEDKQRRGIQSAIVISARQLESDESSRIQDKLSRIAGQNVEITWQIDPLILGGLTIKLGDRIIDGSLTARIRRLQQHLTQES